jgi:hypothetical protein
VRDQDGLHNAHRYRSGDCHTANGMLLNNIICLSKTKNTVARPQKGAECELQIMRETNKQHLRRPMMIVVGIILLINVGCVDGDEQIRLALHRFGGLADLVDDQIQGCAAKKELTWEECESEQWNMRKKGLVKDINHIDEMLGRQECPNDNECRKRYLRLKEVALDADAQEWIQGKNRLFKEYVLRRLSD